MHRQRFQYDVVNAEKRVWSPLRKSDLVLIRKESESSHKILDWLPVGRNWSRVAVEWVNECAEAALTNEFKGGAGHPTKHIDFARTVFDLQRDGSP